MLWRATGRFSRFLPVSVFCVFIGLFVYLFVCFLVLFMLCCAFVIVVVLAVSVIVGLHCLMGLCFCCFGTVVLVCWLCLLALFIL